MLWRIKDDFSRRGFPLALHGFFIRFSNLIEFRRNIELLSGLIMK